MPTPAPETTPGNFPGLTGEEILVEDRLVMPAVERGVEAGLEPEKLPTHLKKTLELLSSPSTRAEGESEVYGMCTALISLEGKPKKPRGLGLGALEKSHVFKRLQPDVGFALAIKAVRAGDDLAFQAITGTIKKEHPLHPDLATFKTAEKETLGHMAAKTDNAKIIQAIAAQNPTHLDIRGADEETIAHTASRFCSWKTIDLLIEARIELFGKKNLRGETPLELAGGTLIRTKIELDEVRRAETASMENKESARAVLQAASKKSPGKPLLEIRGGRLRTEIVPAHEMDIF